MKQAQLTRLYPLDYACNEAINTLATNLTFTGPEIKSVMLTSTRSSAGKTFLSVNLIRTLAELGKRVVLLDTDMRRSIIETKYGLKCSEGKLLGLAHYLAGMCEIEDVLYETDLTGAYIVPIGRKVSNSLALLSTPRFTMLVEALSKQFDYVIVDAPPVGVLIDAAEVARSCDGTLLVVRYNETKRRELSESINQIERTGCKILGAVLNDVTFDSYTSKKYYYKSYYSRYISSEYRVADKKSGSAKSGSSKQGEREAQ